jgi:hypothetical protein
VQPGAPAQSREIFDVELSQSYYTNSNAAQYDTQYQTTLGQAAATNFSPIALNFRALPTDAINANIRASSTHAITPCARSRCRVRIPWTTRCQVSGGWSKRGYIAEIPGVQRLPRRTRFLPSCLSGVARPGRSIASATMHTKDNQGSAPPSSFTYDILHGYIQQAADVVVLQRAVLRHRVEVPDLQLSAEQSSSRRSRRIIASSSRSPWPASATSLRSTGA